MIPIHQFTNGTDYVLLVKCLNRDGTSYGGFRWPESGPVEPINWSREPDCSSGGLFGWPWGLHIGNGRRPDVLADWVVFAARPENVILVEGGPTAKAVPGEDGELPDIVYRGDVIGALEYTQVGREAWLRLYGQTTNDTLGVVSADNVQECALATGDGSTAIVTDSQGAAIAKATQATAIAVGGGSSALAIGEQGVAIKSSFGGSALAVGSGSAAIASSNFSTASVNGFRGVAIAIRNDASVSAAGDGSVALDSGNFGYILATGDQSVALVTGNECTVEVGSCAVGIVTGRNVTWIVHQGAMLTVGWFDEAGRWQVRLFDSYDYRDGEHVVIDQGEVVEVRPQHCARE